jgi:type VI secretion system Hcp family effector
MYTAPAPILIRPTIIKMPHTNYFFSSSINKMKKQFQHQKKILLFFILIISLIGNSQQKFIITGSRANNYCNGTCTLFDNPELNSNPTAVVFVTPVEVNGINLNPHPICAYYNGKQWSVMNVDNATISPGAQFSVTYYSKSDDTHFTHVVTKENLVKNNSYIDNPGLNGNPNAKFQFFQNASPNVRGGSVNKSEIKFQYDEAAGKWYISNSNGSTLDFAAGYNISISSGTNAITIPATTPPVTTLSTSMFPAHSANQFILMTVVGQIQGQFPGDYRTHKITVTNFEMEVNSPRDLSTGKGTGKRQYFPVMIQKANDSSSVQFFKAITTNEKLASVIFEVYKDDIRGIGGILDYKIVLTNASVSDFKQSFATVDKGSPMMDFIKLTFESIKIIDGATSVSDDWAPVN